MKKKYKRKIELREQKAKYIKALTHFQIDVKFLKYRYEECKC